MKDHSLTPKKVYKKPAVDASDDGYPVEPTAPTVITELEMILQRINKARHIVGEISTRAGIVADRNLGPSDDPCCDEDMDHGLGMVSDLNREIDYLMNAIHGLFGEVRRLESL